MKITNRIPASPIRHLGKGPMLHRALHPCRPRVLILAVLAAVLALALAFHYAAQPASAQTPTPNPANESAEASKECLFGILSHVHDPLHCYILDEAVREGKIDIAAIYLAPGPVPDPSGWGQGGPLYIFLHQTDPVDDQLGQYLEEKAHHYLESNNRETGPIHFWVYKARRCADHSGDQRKHCLNLVMTGGTVPLIRAGFEETGEGGFPPLMQYENMFIHPGGAEARKKIRGWASWRQIWPLAEEKKAPETTGFDVSDVDTTNFPELDCYGDSYYILFSTCWAWKWHPDLGITSVFEWNPGTGYIRMKNLPDDPEEQEALKERLVPGYKKYDLNVFLTRSKYDYGQLRRWAIILERFAPSSGNTIALTGGELDTNRFTDVVPEQNNYTWLNGYQQAAFDEKNLTFIHHTVRPVLMVWSLEPRLTIPALPALLPLLGIPADAVGVVRHDRRFPLTMSLDIDTESGPIPPTPRIPATTRR